MASRPDVLFLVLDSLRTDRVSAYGHERETTPALSTLSTYATRYQNAFTQAPWTLPSHTSMFTGAFPSEHGVTNGFSDGMSRLPESRTTLAEHLSDEGYRTAGFSNNPWVGQLSGLDRGFDEFVEWDLEISASDDPGVHTSREEIYSRLHPALGKAARQPLFLLKRRFFTDSLVDRAKRWLARRANSPEPTFTFLNLMEAHSPYFPPERAFEALDLESPSALEPRVLNTKLLTYVMGKSDLAPGTRERVMEYYDASVRYQDEKVEALLGQLQETDLLDDTLVIVCSDHGKTLGDYPREERPPHYVRDINLNVPLWIKRPGQRKGETVNDMFELASLFDVVRDGDPPVGSYTTDVAVAEDFVPHAGRKKPDEITRWRVAADESHKYVRNDAGEEYLYDRTADSRRSRPDQDRCDAYAERLSERVREFGSTADESPSDREIDSSVEAQLKDLGYM
ncbi:sulfatase [Natrinema pellirubrum DSM 15624]|uniref:Sulfatase n=1 Tax=Natrinema pellirubrum (strain DSM 15624 / CIP 106293 / JCM 10476 / NCIMB 786 / 157) TaxID=797303 RepID=L0JLG5_NATP1|nr:sulfatase [Natrinema pellirubrum]AGB31201.1 arylsulfatase A family protein [Natrinema pellirubrum DSM 15624]ELY81435.1 sulfatase [Natrinema pellirubrum DSM 15624]